MPTLIRRDAAGDDVRFAETRAGGKSTPTLDDLSDDYAIMLGQIPRNLQGAAELDYTGRWGVYATPQI